MRETSLAGRTILVSGGSTGIGRACVIAFLAEGAGVHVAALPSADMTSLGDESVAAGRLTLHPGDLTDDRFVDGLAAKVGSIDILVNCAGIAVLAPFLDSDPASWDSMFAVNVRAMLRLTHAVAKSMAARRSGQIITVSSVMAHAVYPNSMVYAATKHAISAIHQGLRLELGSLGIRSTELRPGLVGDTKIQEASTHPAIAGHFTQRPYQPILSVDIARAALFVAKTPPEVDIDVLEVKPVGQP